MAAFDHEDARVSKLPEHSGDGYGWGGGAIVTIGSVSIMLGEGPDAHQLAAEIARRWNAGRAALSPSPSGWNAGAFEAGAKAMREACAMKLEAAELYFRAFAIRALPLPTPPAGEG